jgi:hypothetical protein
MFQRRKCRGANVTRRKCRRRKCRRRKCHQAQVSRGANVGGASVEAQVSEAQKGRRKCRIIDLSQRISSVIQCGNATSILEAVYTSSKLSSRNQILIVNHHIHNVAASVRPSVRLFALLTFYWKELRSCNMA